MTGETDIILIYLEDKPLAFARIEEITADYKPGWNHVRMLLLQIPLQTVTWILRDAYIDGTPFTMDGKKMRLEKVMCPEEPEIEEEPEIPVTPKTKRKSAKTANTKVISLSDFKKK